MNPNSGTILMSEADHRIANNLALLAGLVRSQAAAIGKKGKAHTAAETHFLLDGISARISMIAQIHRRIALSPDSNIVALGPHLREICDGFVAAFSSELQPVHVDYRLGECLVPAKFVQPLTLIVCELLLNALKYAHPAHAPLKFGVSCEERKGDLVLTIDDDGVGLPEGLDSATDGDFGFRAIRRMCAQIEASLDVQSSSLGTSFEIAVWGIAVPSAQTA